MDGAEPTGQTRDRTSRALVPLLLVLWVTLIGLSWWSAPRPATLDQAVASMTTGDARAVAREPGRPSSVVGHVLSAPRSAPSTDSGQYLVWQDSTLRHHWIDLSDQQVRGRIMAHADPADSAVTSAPDEVSAAAMAFSQQAMPTGASRLPDAGTIVDAVTALVSLALVFLGPCRRGTRWFWAWLLLVGLPLDLGLLAYCWMELLDRGTAGREARLTGGWSFLMVIVAGLAASTLP